MASGFSIMSEFYVTPDLTIDEVENDETPPSPAFLSLSGSDAPINDNILIDWIYPRDDLRDDPRDDPRNDPRDYLRDDLRDDPRDDPRHDPRDEPCDDPRDDLRWHFPHDEISPIPHDGIFPIDDSVLCMMKHYFVQVIMFLVGELRAIATKKTMQLLCRKIVKSLFKSNVPQR